MSKFTTKKINLIEPYVPGEQPKDLRYIKLNTNENPYYTSRTAVNMITDGLLEGLNRYSDPECRELVRVIADYYGVGNDNVLVTNGSDEALAFCFFAYGNVGVCYPDVTYGFYDVIANLYGCQIEHIALKEDFTVNVSDYYNKKKTVVLANPNAQTGIAVPVTEVEKIVANNRNNIVILDQAYVDFGDANALPLINKYDNIVVVNTFSKSRSLAGARVGYVIADKKLIDDLKKVKNSFHPYNVNSVSAALAAGAINDDVYFRESVELIKDERERLSEGLRGLGFCVLPSAANFVLTKHKAISGSDLYEKLKSKGVLVRHFNDERIRDFVRITVGTRDEVKQLLEIMAVIIREAKNEDGRN